MELSSTPFYQRPKANYLDGSGLSEMLDVSKPGNDAEIIKNIKEFASTLSEVFHEDWKSNLIKEKGKEYQHFRPVKDETFEKEVLADFVENKYQGKYREAKSIDGKNLFRVNNGKVEFDLIRVPFDKLTKKWKNANYDAALFALCLVKKAIEKEGKIDFSILEKMSSDVHEFWVLNNTYQGQKNSLLTPYNLLTVDSILNNEKDKDRVHSINTMNEISKPNILDRNRTIVERALEIVFNNNKLFQVFATDKYRSDLLKEIQKQNEKDYQRCNSIKQKFLLEADKEIQGAEYINYNLIEKLSANFYNIWAEENKDLIHLDQLKKPYQELVVNNVEFNPKNFARELTVKYLKEYIQKKTTTMEANKLDTLTNTVNNFYNSLFVKQQNINDFNQFINSFTLKPKQASQIKILPNVQRFNKIR